MTCEEFTQLRFLELAFWARNRYGKGWRGKFCSEAGIEKHRRINIESMNSKVNLIQPFETWARERGFKSRYDSGPFESHAAVLSDFKARHSKGVGERFSDAEQDELFSGLGFHSSPQEAGSELRPGHMPRFTKLGD